LAEDPGAVQRRTFDGTASAGVAKVTACASAEGYEIRLLVTCLGQPVLVSAWVPIAGLAVIAVLVWVVVAADR
jgi:hypothetical protein